MLQAAFSTLELIYHVTVNDLRKGQRNAVVLLLMTVLQSVAMIAGFYLMFVLLGVRKSPIQGDFIVYIMSGIFMFMCHTQAIGAVSSAGNPGNNMMAHGPMNTAITISAGALAVLYRQTFSSVVILTIYGIVVTPVELENPLACYGMLLLAWFSGCCIGLSFLAIGVWWPQAAQVITQFYQRINMLASGKMFVANTLPLAMVHMFAWNPLFHIIDQTRGFAFINYTPKNSNIEYPIYATLALLMIGLMAEFVTRKSFSVSWNATR